MAKNPRETSELSLKLDWSGFEDPSIHFVNRFAVQHDAQANEFYLNVGAVSPPLLMGSDTDVMAAAAKLRKL